MLKMLYNFSVKNKMAKSQAPRKKKAAPRKDEIQIEAKHFLFSVEDSADMAKNAQEQLYRFKRGQADKDNRATLKIRLIAGLHILEQFHHDGADLVLNQALEIINNSNKNKLPTGHFVLSVDDVEVVQRALFIIETMFSEAGLWAEIEAMKVGEDKMVVNADKWEYVFVKHVN